jgi:hypothetical protein
MGQPIDAWSRNLPLDTGVTESVEVTVDGGWRWIYTGRNAIFGGTVRTEITLDPVTGRIVAASRSDPIGRTDYAVDYGVVFPPIAVPGG